MIKRTINGDRFSIGMTINDDEEWMMKFYKRLTETNDNKKDEFKKKNIMKERIMMTSMTKMITRTR